MNVLHLLRSGGIGGIEILSKNIALGADWSNVFCFVHEGGIVTEEIKSCGGKTEILHNNDKLSLVTLIKLIMICRREKIDIIETHHMDIYLHFYYLLLMHFRHKAKFIITLHSCAIDNKNIKPSKKLRLRRYFLEKALKKSDHIIAVSEAVKKSYMKYYKVKSEKISIVYNGIPLDTLTQGYDNQPKIKERFELLYIGRLTMGKGIDILLYTVQLLLKEYKVKLTIVGDGAFRPYCESLVRKLDIEQYVVFAGFDRELEKYYTECNIFVYPSLYEEAFGISIVEAMSWGLICVGTNKGGIPEVIQDNVNGFISEKATPYDLYLAISKAVQVYKLNKYIEFGLESKKQAAKFCIDNTLKQMKCIYTNILLV